MRFLRRAVERLLSGDVPGIREAWVETVAALRQRRLTTHEVASRVRLTKSPEQYHATRDGRRELPYEAMLLGGRQEWRRGERVRVYRVQGGAAGLVTDAPDGVDPANYDVEHYVRVLRDHYAVRLASAFAPTDHAALFADPDRDIDVSGGVLGDPAGVTEGVRGEG